MAKSSNYSGSLTAAEVADGMNAARRNARRLVADARLLLDRQRYPSAAALAILSIEESGKLGILRRLVLAASGAEAKKMWKDYRRHTAKNIMWILPQLVASGARTLDELREVVDPTSDHAEVLDRLKQLSVYTDCVGSRKWTEPDDLVPDHLAAHLVTAAELLTGARDISAEEMELWVKHIGQLADAPWEWHKTALANWHRECVERGLLPPDTDPIEPFLGRTHQAVEE